MAQLNQFAAVCVSKEDLLKRLSEVGLADNDFSGENGEECLWDIAKENGFQSNIDYAIAQAEKYEDPKLIVERFMHEWMFHDTYYLSYNVLVESLKKKKVYPLLISIAWTC